MQQWWITPVHRAWCWRHCAGPTLVLYLFSCSIADTTILSVHPTLSQTCSCSLNLPLILNTYVGNTAACTHCIRTRLCTQLGIWRSAFKWIFTLNANAKLVIGYGVAWLQLLHDIIFDIIANHFQCYLNICSQKYFKYCVLLPQFSACNLELFYVLLAFRSLYCADGSLHCKFFYWREHQQVCGTTAEPQRWPKCLQQVQ